MRYTRLDRLVAEYEGELPVGQDHGMAGGATAHQTAKALLEADENLEDDDRAYLEAIVAGEREDDEPA